MMTKMMMTMMMLTMTEQKCGGEVSVLYILDLYSTFMASPPSSPRERDVTYDGRYESPVKSLFSFLSTKSILPFDTLQLTATALPLADERGQSL